MRQRSRFEDISRESTRLLDDRDLPRHRGMERAQEVVVPGVTAPEIGSPLKVWPAAIGTSISVPVIVKVWSAASWFTIEMPCDALAVKQFGSNAKSEIVIVKVAPSPVRSTQPPLSVVPVVPVSAPVVPPPSSDEHAVSPRAHTATSTNTSFIILSPEIGPAKDSRGCVRRRVRR